MPNRKVGAMNVDLLADCRFNQFKRCLCFVNRFDAYCQWRTIDLLGWISYRRSCIVGLCWFFLTIQSLRCHMLLWVNSTIFTQSQDYLSLFYLFSIPKKETLSCYQIFVTKKSHPENFSSPFFFFLIFQCFQLSRNAYSMIVLWILSNLYVYY